MTLRVPIRPELLQWACDRAGRRPDDLARRFPGFTAWLTGDRAPTLKQVEAFARATHTPVGYLLLAEPPDERVPIPDLRTMGGRAVARPSPNLLDTIYLCERQQDWYRQYARTEGEGPLPCVGSAAITDDVVAVATEIREVLCYESEAREAARGWAEAFRLFVRAAEAAGVLVMVSGVVGTNTRRKLDPAEFRGFALIDRLAPLVFVNGADAKAAQMFTLAHELAHVWLGQAALSDVAPGVTRPHRIERWCNAVAAELLVPLSELRAGLDPRAEVSGELRRLAAHFKVSTLVIARRLHDVGAVDETGMWAIYRAELARAAAAAGRRGGGGDFYLTQGARLGRRFARALIHSTRSGRTSYREAFKLSGCRRRETFDALAKRLGVPA